jgi:putative cell wall-binding protein
LAASKRRYVRGVRRLVVVLALVATTLFSRVPEASACPDRLAVTRLAGADRIETAIRISNAGFPGNGSASAAVLARSDNFADALAGTPLAVATRAPLLLTSATALDTRVRDELRRALPAGLTVFLMGGTSALSRAVEDQVRASGFVPKRIAGADRYETAVAAANEVPGGREKVFLATGRNFPDGIVAGALAYQQGAALLFTDDNTLPAATRNYLARGITTVFAFGDQAAAAYPTAIPIAGADRYETAAKAAETFAGGNNQPPQIGVATGENFPDALAGGALVTQQAGGPILLTRRDSLPARVDRYIVNHAFPARAVYVFGDEGVASRAVGDRIKQDVDGACGP